MSSTQIGAIGPLRSYAGACFLMLASARARRRAGCGHSADCLPSLREGALRCSACRPVAELTSLAALATFKQAATSQTTKRADARGQQACASRLRTRRCARTPPAALPATGSGASLPRHCPQSGSSTPAIDRDCEFAAEPGSCLWPGHRSNDGCLRPRAAWVRPVAATHPAPLKSPFARAPQAPPRRWRVMTRGTICSAASHGLLPGPGVSPPGAFRRVASATSNTDRRCKVGASTGPVKPSHRSSMGA